MTSGIGRCALAVLVVLGAAGCQGEPPTEAGKSPPPTSRADDAARQAVDAMQQPMDRARSVESTLGQAADQTADPVKESAP